MVNRIFLLLLIIFLGSCAPTRFVKPLAKKQQAVNLSLGGPLISLNNISVPVPFLSATYGYGLDSNLTGFAGLNLTSVLYGNLQAELGITKGLIKPHGNLPGVSITPVANIIYRKNAGIKIFPQLDANAWWEFNRHRNILYAGISNWFELSGTKASGVSQKDHWLITPMVGHTFLRKKSEFTIELKIIAPQLNNDKVAVDYKTPFGIHGAFGIYFGYTRKF